MVGSGGGGGGGGDSRSKEAVGMMALHEALRNVCLNSDWTYSVFWTIRPRPRCRGGNGCKVGDDNGSLMLMWEDGFCRTRMTAECLEEIDGEDPVRKAFSKMSIQLYNYGEGLMGKVASDKCHKWVFKEPTECEPNISNYWQSSFDALPPEWTDQFASGIQTIAVIQAGHGLLQLGSCKIIPEDLHFVLRMRHMFESLGYQSGFFLSQLFSSTRTSSPSSSSTPMKQTPMRPPPPLFNWNHPVPLPSTSPLPSNFHPSPQIGLMPNKDINTHHFLLPHHHHQQQQQQQQHDAGPIDEMMSDHHHNYHHHHHQHDSDLKWPNGLSFFTALTGRSDDAKLLFGHEGLANNNKPQVHHSMMHSSSQMNLCGGNADQEENNAAASGTNTEDHLGLDDKAGKMEPSSSGHKFKRSFTMPARMATSSTTSSSSLDQHQNQQHHAASSQGMEYRSSEAGIYSDIMETFLE